MTTCAQPNDLSHSRPGWTRMVKQKVDVLDRPTMAAGTHALRPSKSSLWGRLSQHKGNVGGSTPGGGNHRGSVFRLHVGTALLASGAWPKPIRDSWSVGSAANSDVRSRGYPLERAVSGHVGAMPALWLDIDDTPGPDSDRERDRGRRDSASQQSRPPSHRRSVGRLARSPCRPAPEPRVGPLERQPHSRPSERRGHRRARALGRVSVAPPSIWHRDAVLGSCSNWTVRVGDTDGFQSDRAAKIRRHMSEC